VIASLSIANLQVQIPT